MNIRHKIAAVLFFLSITLFGFTLAPVLAAAQSVYTPTSVDVSMRSNIISLADQDRATYGDGSLTENAALDAAAQKKANDMLANQYFAHVAPNGTTPWKWFAQSGYSYVYAGENLAMDFYSASDVETAWMNSPTHRANVLGSHYKDIGIGIARGTYEGKPVVFIVEFFGAK